VTSQIGPNDVSVVDIRALVRVLCFLSILLTYDIQYLYVLSTTSRLGCQWMATSQMGPNDVHIRRVVWAYMWFFKYLSVDTR